MIQPLCVADLIVQWFFDTARPSSKHTALRRARHYLKPGHQTECLPQWEALMAAPWESSPARCGIGAPPTRRAPGYAGCAARRIAQGTSCDLGLMTILEPRPCRQRCIDHGLRVVCGGRRRRVRRPGRCQQPLQQHRQRSPRRECWSQSQSPGYRRCRCWSLHRNCQLPAVVKSLNARKCSPLTNIARTSSLVQFTPPRPLCVVSISVSSTF